MEAAKTIKKNLDTESKAEETGDNADVKPSVPVESLNNVTPTNNDVKPNIANNDTQPNLKSVDGNVQILSAGFSTNSYQVLLIIIY